MNNVYINGLGAYLPGSPVSNDDIESYIGKVFGKSSKYRTAALRQNRIVQRHYALEPSGVWRADSASMAAAAIRDAIANSETLAGDIGYLATASTLGDGQEPGLASHVHAELGLGSIEIANFQSVCASSMMALKSAFLQLKCGEHSCAAVSGSEFASRYFRPGAYENVDTWREAGEIPFEADFLRFTLSDGAGAALLETRPNARKKSLRILWIDIRSFAHRFDPCMTGGVVRDQDGWRPWSSFESPIEAAKAGAFVLTQDFELMHRMLPVWVSHYLDLISRGMIVIDEIDHLCSHYSSHGLRRQIIDLLEQAGAMIDEDKWFTNLYTKGNTGSASIFVILEDLCRQDLLKTGDRILCHVPESGRSLNGFMMLEVE